MNVARERVFAMHRGVSDQAAIKAANDLYSEAVAAVIACRKSMARGRPP
jgi:acyl-CoA synthetase (AMP-forming)/AMP-acid ligase II